MSKVEHLRKKRLRTMGNNSLARVQAQTLVTEPKSLIKMGSNGLPNFDTEVRPSGPSSHSQTSSGSSLEADSVRISVAVPQGPPPSTAFKSSVADTQAYHRFTHFLDKEVSDLQSLQIENRKKAESLIKPPHNKSHTINQKEVGSVYQLEQSRKQKTPVITVEFDIPYKPQRMSILEKQSSTKLVHNEDINMFDEMGPTTERKVYMNSQTEIHQNLKQRVPVTSQKNKSALASVVKPRMPISDKSERAVLLAVDTIKKKRAVLETRMQEQGKINITCADTPKAVSRSPENGISSREPNKLVTNIKTDADGSSRYKGQSVYNGVIGPTLHSNTNLHCHHSTKQLAANVVTTGYNSNQKKTQGPANPESGRKQIGPICSHYNSQKRLRKCSGSFVIQDNNNDLDSQQQLYKSARKSSKNVSTQLKTTDFGSVIHERTIYRHNDGTTVMTPQSKRVQHSPRFKQVRELSIDGASKKSPRKKKPIQLVKEVNQAMLNAAFSPSNATLKSRGSNYLVTPKSHHPMEPFGSFEPRKELSQSNSQAHLAADSIMTHQHSPDKPRAPASRRRAANDPKEMAVKKNMINNGDLETLPIQRSKVTVVSPLDEHFYNKRVGSFESIGSVGTNQRGHVIQNLRVEASNPFKNTLHTPSSNLNHYDLTAKKPRDTEFIKQKQLPWVGDTSPSHDITQVDVLDVSYVQPQAKTVNKTRPLKQTTLPRQTIDMLTADGFGSPATEPNLVKKASAVSQPLSDMDKVEPEGSIFNKFKSFFVKGKNNGEVEALTPDRIIDDDHSRENPAPHLPIAEKQSSLSLSNKSKSELPQAFDPHRTARFPTLFVENQASDLEDGNNGVEDLMADWKYEKPRQYQCTCGSTEGNTFACVKATRWLHLARHGVSAKGIQKMIALYQVACFSSSQLNFQNLLDCRDENGSGIQIDRDIARTFPKCDQFQQTEGQLSLKRVLLAFSLYDQSLGKLRHCNTVLGYVQGMNFIVGSLLYHCNEEFAFWLFVSMIEDFELRDIYQPGLPGLYKHCQMLNFLLFEHLPDLANHFVKTLSMADLTFIAQNEYQISVEMYASDWIFGLFCSIVPIAFMGDFYDSFFEDGWSYFYKFCLSMLWTFKQKLLVEEEFSGILSHIKFKSPSKDYREEPEGEKLQISSPRRVNSSNAGTEKEHSSGEKRSRVNRFLSFLIKKQEGIWSRIFSQCQAWVFNEDEIKWLLSNYDMESHNISHPRFVVNKENGFISPKEQLSVPDSN